MGHFINGWMLICYRVRYSTASKFICIFDITIWHDDMAMFLYCRLCSLQQQWNGSGADVWRTYCQRDCCPRSDCSTALLHRLPRQVQGSTSLSSSLPSPAVVIFFHLPYTVENNCSACDGMDNKHVRLSELLCAVLCTAILLYTYARAIIGCSYRYSRVSWFRW